MNTDIIIIGSGPGGYRAAEYAAKNGLRVVIFEQEHAGGTCLNCGCIPTKTFCHDATLPIHDYQQTAARKNEVVALLRTGVEQLMNQPGITFVRGKAVFKDANTIVCNNEKYTATNIIIATGSKAKILSFAQEAYEKGGAYKPQVVTSTELLNIETIPNHLAIIGAGVIGMEFASIFNAFGSQVSVIEYLKECLPAIDGDIAKRLRKSLEKRGVEFHMQAAVQDIKDGKIVFERKGKTEEIQADVVLIATGREPNIDGLELEKAGIVFDQKGIRVNEQFEVIRESTFVADNNTPQTYAIGDVNGTALLAHAATMQGIKVVNRILKKNDQIQLNIMPAAVFTTPEVATVGLTEEQCKEQGIAYKCKKGLYRANGKALAMNETDGIVKLIATEGTDLETDGTILGCHVMGAHAADIVQEVAVLMNLGVTVQRLCDIIHIHPTLGEILQTTAESF